MELWLSGPTVAPGEWVQAVVRATNVGSDTAWYWPGICSGSTQILVDLSPVIAPGVAQTGNAAVLKKRAIRDSGAQRTSFTTLRFLLEAEGGVAVSPWAECTSPGEVAPLAPGVSIDEAFAWYPDGGVGQPLPPGTVPVAVHWPFAARGHRPHITWTHAPWHDITVRTTIELTGAGPGTPSVPELIDTALADPRFHDWVDARPDTHGWWVDVNRSPGPSYIGVDQWATISDRVPDGVFEIMLAQDVPGSKEHIGVAILDPWTGELVDVLFAEDF